MRTLLLAFALLLAVAAAPARGAPETEPFTAVEALLKSAPVVRGRFEQTRTLRGIAKPLVSSGDFVVDRSRGVLWRTQRPFPNVLRITGEEIVQLDGEQVLMRLRAEQEPTVRSVGRVLRALFAGDLAGLRAHFDATGSVQDGNWQLQLTPRDAGLARAIRSVSLQGADTLRSMELTAASGDVTRIAYRDVALAETLADAERAALE